VVTPAPRLATCTAALLGLEDRVKAAIAADGHLQGLARPGAFPSLAGATATQQVMHARHFPIAGGGATKSPGCSFLVHYPGPAQDMNAWLSHYIASHPPIMRRFPGIRQIEILSRVDWIDAMPFARVEHAARIRPLASRAPLRQGADR